MLLTNAEYFFMRFASTEAPVSEVQVAHGVPALDRKVTIYSPARTAGQQGMAQTVEGDTSVSGEVSCGVLPLSAR